MESPPSTFTPPSILIVEDNHHDALLLIRSFKALKPDWIPMTVGDGEAAMRWLTRCAAKVEDIPRAIILDLSLPGVSGPELLRWIETQPHLSGVKAFVVSGHVEKPTSLPSASGRWISYLPKPASAFAIAAVLVTS
jgi:CheY-like chemotaxis protein